MATLVLGWHLGRQYEQRALLLSEYYIADSDTGSGKILLNPQQDANLSLMWRTWKLLNQYYVEPDQLTSDKLTMGAVEGLVRSVGDPYTTFMSPKQNESFRDMIQGSLEGIGAELTVRDELIVVVSPLKGSPAEKAGLLPEDVIAKVNGEDIAGLSLDEVISRVRGKKGTTVTLTIYHKGESTPVDLAIERQQITVPSLESEVKTATGGQVGYIALHQFGDHSMQEVRDALESFEGQNIKGIIVDLRFNGGGYLDGAVDFVSIFLSEGLVVQVQKRGGDIDKTEVLGDAQYPDIPLVVLINEGSASASEIMAGALQDQDRATIIGKTSFGKGTVQDVIDLPGGSSLRVTVAHWLTPNGKNLGKEGVEPDIEVDRSIEDYKADRDPQLDAALLWLTEGKDVTK